jgi:hypothetical protein
MTNSRRAERASQSTLHLSEQQFQNLTGQVQSKRGLRAALLIEPC